MKVEPLFHAIPILETYNWDPKLSINKITSDSRAVEPGDVFVSCSGSRMDGHDFMAEAIHAGASVIVFEDLPEEGFPRNVVGVRVADSRRCLADLLRKYHGCPDEKIHLIGVTGTNGKTTIAYLLYKLMKEKEPSAYVGTLGYEYEAEGVKAINTTPGPEILYPLLSRMQKSGIKYCFMEVSSHALDQSRVAGLSFDLAIFTQLTQDHLDYHKTMESYYQAKRELFSQAPKPKQMLINRDCAYGRRLLEEYSGAKSYSVSKQADYQVKNIENSMQGSRFDFRYLSKQPKFEIRIPLQHNVSNMTAILGAIHLLGFSPEDFQGALKDLPGVSGRMERIIGSSDFDIFVDYAHTPDAFEHVLGEAKLLKPKRMLTLFGCGGDRDQEKRPLMASVAAKYSDVIVMTSDNPRSEDPANIMKDMKRGVPASGNGVEVIEIQDRRKAIDQLIGMAEAGDVLFILGKGHEDYQILGEKRVPFDDREIVRECLKRKAVFSLHDASRHLNTQLFFPQSPDHATGAIHDTRQLSEGELFVSLTGENTSGDVYLQEAFLKGASGALVSQSDFETKSEVWKEKIVGLKNLIPVESVQNALQELAEWQRLKVKAPVIGITGSVGKTTTKEFLRYLLSLSYDGVANQGNFNNQLGVPLTLLRCEESSEYVLCEMGASRKGDIKELGDILKPTIGAITRIAPAHLEGFGSLEGVYETKTEIFDSLPKGAKVVLPGDDPELLRRAAGHDLDTSTVGWNESDDFTIKKERSESGSDLCFSINGEGPYRFKGVGEFMIENAAFAYAIARHLNVPLEKIPAEWEGIRWPKGRMQEVELVGAIRVLDDTYNASPRAFSEAVKAFQNREVSGRKILVISDMLELGDESGRYHRKLGEEIDACGFDLVIGYGPETKTCFEAMGNKTGATSLHYFGDRKTASSFLIENVREQDSLLLKGSRSMQVDTILDDLRNQLEKA